MHRKTVQIYERRGLTWAAARKPVRRRDAKSFGKRVPQGEIRIDLGCGAGRYISDIGVPAIGVDAARSMLRECHRTAPGVPLVQGDLEHLPFGKGTASGAWANMSYLHLQRTELPMALADLHRVLVVGATLDIQVLAGDYEGDALPGDDVGGRFFCGWRPDRLEDVLIGAGFSVDMTILDREVVRTTATRIRTLPDFVARDMRLLVVGLNPSLFAADAGIGFARPGNRFWPAAILAGLLTRDRDPCDALRSHHIGTTDLVKRATVRADELTVDEYRSGFARIARLVEWLAPRAVCFVGLSGWRAAVDPGARAGVQDLSICGSPVYVMPSTSGANAHSDFQALSNHLRKAAALADSSPRRGPHR